MRVQVLQMTRNMYLVWLERERFHVDRKGAENTMGSLHDFAILVIPDDTREFKVHDKHCVPSHG